MEQSFLRTVTELFFSVFPTGFFVQMLDALAAILNALFGAIGIQTNIVGF